MDYLERLDEFLSTYHPKLGAILRNARCVDRQDGEGVEDLFFEIRAAMVEMLVQGISLASSWEKEKPGWWRRAKAATAIRLWEPE